MAGACTEQSGEDLRTQPEARLLGKWHRPEADTGPYLVLVGLTVQGPGEGRAQRSGWGCA